jgi:hypothetical protein
MTPQKTGLSAAIFFAAQPQKRISAAIPCAGRKTASHREPVGNRLFYAVRIRKYFSGETGSETEVSEPVSVLLHAW